MGKSKFIDKKTAAHYSLICRVTDDQDGRDGAAEPSLNDERAFARLDVRRVAQRAALVPH